MLRQEQPEEQRPQITIRPDTSTTNSSLPVPIVQEPEAVADTQQQTRAMQVVAPQQDSPGVKVEIVAAIDERIKLASNVSEIKELLKVRAELLKQNAALEEKQHSRRMDYWQMVYKAVMTVPGVAVGAFLVSKGYSTEGFLVLGASFYPLSGKFVMALLTQVFDKRRQNSQAEQDNNNEQ